jgi:hypothetical protein
MTRQEQKEQEVLREYWREQQRRHREKERIVREALKNQRKVYT